MYSDKEELLFYYCKNEKNITEKLDEIIMPIKFFSKEFSYIFEINSSDILMVKNEYIYFKILFRKKSSDYWVLGKIFSLKYKLIFNAELREIGLYKKFKNNTKSDNTNENVDDNSDKSKLVVQITVIGLLCLLFLILGLILGKKIYKYQRKKRANEMDDNYEYIADDKIPDNSKNEDLPKNKEENAGENNSIPAIN